MSAMRIQWLSRLIEIILPDSQVTRDSQALEEQAVLGVWQDKLVGNQTLLRVLVSKITVVL